MLRRTGKKIMRLLSAARLCHRQIPVWSLGYLPTFSRALRLCRRDGFEPAEAFRLGLFDPDLPRTKSGNFVSRRNLTRIQRTLNPESWAPLVRNKGVFYRYCMAEVIPIPRLYAILFGSGMGWSHEGDAMENCKDWQAFLAHRLPDEFVVKPAQGAYGRGVNIFLRKGEAFVDARGTPYAAAEIYHTLRLQAGRDSIIFQERLRNHPELLRLSGTKSLQTVRIITLLAGDGSCRILHAHFKPIVGRHIVDTYFEGMAGNVEAPIHVDGGLLQAANQITGTGRGIQTIAVHPQTGVAFEHFRLPFWRETCDLVRQMAPRFLPLRSIGWDIGITPTGPRVVEGNVWWDPPNQHGCMAAVAETLNEAGSGMR